MEEEITENEEKRPQRASNTLEASEEQHKVTIG